MIVKGNPKRLLIGLWVLAALLILWYNAAAMTSLFDRPLPGLSPEARETITKYQRLENQIKSRFKDKLTIQELTEIVAHIDLESVRKIVLPVKKSLAKPKAVKKPKKIIAKPKQVVTLPSLNGIMAVYDKMGHVVYLAVIDGKTREEKSSVGKFVIDKIEADGVHLKQDKDSWFITAPRVDFSIDASGVTRESGPK